MRACDWPVIIIEEMQGIVAKTDKKKRGDLVSKELDPWLESASSFRTDKEGIGDGGGGTEWGPTEI